MDARNQSNEILRYYDDVKSQDVEWLWYPYIPYGKITLLQGDPGDGKSFLMMNLIGCFTRGLSVESSKNKTTPINVIYQCSEDGIADTIKPRLMKAHADCRRVAFIDEEINELTLESDLLKKAIEESGAKLVVIDPIQAYLGTDGNLNSVSKIRKLMHRLGLWAAIYGCAIVLIGHMNKKEGSKELYRSVGSIDIVAAARSVIQISRLDDSATIRKIHHVKSSLAPFGEEVLFELSPSTGFRWIDLSENQIEKECEVGSVAPPREDSKQQIVAGLLNMWLKEDDLSTDEIKQRLKAINISYRTARIVKSEMNISSYKRGKVWYWSFNKLGIGKCQMK